MSVSFVRFWVSRFVHLNDGTLASFQMTEGTGIFRNGFATSGGEYEWVVVTEYVLMEFFVEIVQQSR